MRPGFGSRVSDRGELPHFGHLLLNSVLETSRTRRVNALEDSKTSMCTRNLGTMRGGPNIEANPNCVYWGSISA